MKRPKIIWKFVVFDHNKHELDIVIKRYRELGFDDYEIVQNFQSNDSKKERQAYKASLRKKSKGCFWPWHAMIIHWDGEIHPCCSTHRSSSSFNLGNAIHGNAREIWRSEEYKILRKGFSSKGKMNDICRKCLGYDIST